jgi:hypothetical protein
MYLTPLGWAIVSGVIILLITLLLLIGYGIHRFFQTLKEISEHLGEVRDELDRAGDKLDNSFKSIKDGLDDCQLSLKEIDTTLDAEYRLKR